jgi:AraC-like DNA-binding protein
MDMPLISVQRLCVIARTLSDHNEWKSLTKYASNYGVTLNRMFMPTLIPVLFCSIKHIIAMPLADGYPHIDLVAETMSMSRRALQHRLAANSLSYSELANRVCLDRAARFLADTDMPVTQIAVSPGYT